MVNILCLVGDLETGCTHAEVHRIHVDLTRVRLSIFRCFHIGELILVEGYLDIDFLTAPFIDGLS